MDAQVEKNYLPLTDYSTKYRVSISTLRRRIKANDINFRFDQGKYFIFDEVPQSPSQESVKIESRPSLKFEAKRVTETLDGLREVSAEELAPSRVPKNEEPILTAANRLLTELKRAYTQILQEKEEQVLHLKEEVADLKTLVRVLESENERLNTKSPRNNSGAF